VVQFRRTLEMLNFTKLWPIKQKVSTVENMAARAAPQTFNQQVLQKVRNGASVPSVATELGISEGIIYAWKQKYEQQDGSRVTALERENAQLHQQLKQMKMERDILKKATAIFAKSG
jgi:transposase